MRIHALKLASRASSCFYLACLLPQRPTLGSSVGVLLMQKPEQMYRQMHTCAYIDTYICIYKYMRINKMNKYTCVHTYQHVYICRCTCSSVVYTHTSVSLQTYTVNRISSISSATNLGACPTLSFTCEAVASVSWSYTLLFLRAVQE